MSVSLLSDVSMSFDNPKTGEKFAMILPRRSALVLTGEARYLWRHQIAARKIDRVGNDL